MTNPAHNATPRSTPVRRIRFLEDKKEETTAPPPRPQPSEPYLCVNTTIFFVSCIINQTSRGVFRTGSLCHPIAAPQEPLVLTWDSRKTHINIQCNGDQLLRLL